MKNGRVDTTSSNYCRPLQYRVEVGEGQSATCAARSGFGRTSLAACRPGRSTKTESHWNGLAGPNSVQFVRAMAVSGKNDITLGVMA